ncbi:AI-2E family transporter [Flaviflagellibacter deserti]|uniref:AI-2E family transporter n=1 Tax=Flaviflagellibacter deserti TaxID=2267266 RepID=A0ABV9Z3Q0_9HYPH
MAEESKRAEVSSLSFRQQPIEVSMRGLLRSSIIGIFLIMLIGAMYFAQDLLMPIALAFMFSILLSPIVRAGAKWRIPEWMTATSLVLLLFFLIALGVYSLSGPVSQWIDDAPRIGSEVQKKLSGIRASLGFVVQVTEQVSQMTTQNDPGVQRVVLKEPGFLRSAATGVPAVVAKVGLTLVLLLFLLASGDLFREKLVKILPTLSDKKRAIHISRDIEREVSRYLLTITGINIATGAFIGVGMWIIGMPNPVLWGVLATFLTYIPYLGALIGIILVACVALVSFETVSYAMLAPGIYLLAAMLEGQVLTPMIVGRRLEMNAVAILLAVAFWGWVWGIVGVLMAVPLLVMVKVFSDHVEGLDAIGQFLSARETHTPPAEEAEARAKPAAA